MSQTQTDTLLDRPAQILDAAVVCFAKRGFHQASMHDISAEAGISVGLIYRYFQNKEAKHGHQNIGCNRELTLT